MAKEPRHQQLERAFRRRKIKFKTGSAEILPEHFLLAMLAGGTALLRPAVARRLLGLPDHEGTVYALRIGGMERHAKQFARLSPRVPGNPEPA